MDTSYESAAGEDVGAKVRKKLRFECARLRRNELFAFAGRSETHRQLTIAELERRRGQAVATYDQLIEVVRGLGGAS